MQAQGQTEDTLAVRARREAPEFPAREVPPARCQAIRGGLEARALREELGEKLLIVTPGIRPVENRPADDQKRVVTVEEAFGNGADYIVVGRPIQNAPDPRQAAEGIQGSIAGLFG